MKLVDDIFRTILYLVRVIGYDPSYFSMHGTILIRMGDYIMTYWLCLNTSFACLKHVIYGHATKWI